MEEKTKSVSSTSTASPLSKSRRATKFGLNLKPVEKALTMAMSTVLDSPPKASEGI